MSGKIRIAQGGRKFAGVLPGPSGPLGKVGMYNGFYMRNIMDSLPLFSAPLLTSLILAVGVGNPTFTRASTATVTDFEGVVRTTVAGEARFTGARRVQNLLQNTGFLLGGDPPTGWARIAALGIHTITPSLSDATHNQINFSIDNAREIMSYVVDLVAGHSYTLSCYCEAKNEIVALSDTSLFLVQTTAVFTGTPSVATRLFVPGKRVNGTALTCTTSGQATFRLGLGCGANEPGKGSISLSHPQIEDITGATNQNAGDYVSQGVLTAPFQGAGVDGVQYFNNSNGNTVPVFPLLVPGSGTPIPPATLLGYLDEGGRTNLVIQSEDYSTASWVDTILGAGTRANSAAAYRVGGNDCLCTATVAGAGARQVVAGLAAVNHTVSFFVKAGTGTTITFFLENGGAAYGLTSSFNLDLNTGIASTVVGNTPTVVAYKGGWKVSQNLGVAAGLLQANLEWRNPNIGTTFFLGMPQLEPSATFASSYIPTVAAAVTRNADQLTYIGSGGANLSNAVGTVYAELSTEWTTIQATGIAVGASDLSGRVLYCASGTASTIIASFDGTTVNSVAGPDMSVTPRKVASSWGVSQKITSNGATPNGNAFDGAMGGVGNIGIGCNGAGGNEWFGNIRNVQIWGQQLPDATLQSLTT